MAITMKGRYDGQLRTELQHLPSKTNVLTDAPPDNHGRGEAFSPTDLVSAALSSCMMTLMGIVAEREGIDITGMTSDIEKIMASHPRKISEIRITFSHPSLQATDIQKQKLIQAARTCPVALSLSESIRQEITFNF
jgi:putative redox protein